MITFHINSFGNGTRWILEIERTASDLNSTLVVEIRRTFKLLRSYISRLKINIQSKVREREREEKYQFDCGGINECVSFIMKDSERSCENPLLSITKLVSTNCVCVENVLLLFEHISCK